MLICLWFMFAVLQVSCESKSTTTHSTQFMDRTEEGSVLCMYTKFAADSSIRSKFIRGPKILKLGHVTRPRLLRGRPMVRTQDGSVLYVCTKFEADSLIRSKVTTGSPKFRNWVTWPRPRPRRGHFVVHTQEGSVYHLYCEFEAHSSIRSKVIRGSRNYEIGSRDPKPRRFWTLRLNLCRNPSNHTYCQFFSSWVHC